ncbi:MAG: DUF2283 domain-containing protein [Bacteroidetes bacterium]|jgi:uncharacterized protein YuzE|nr:DUF2283 domain-containing protein [Bacteroidota bacterium]
MTIKYDKEADAMYLKFSDAEVAESDEDKPGIIIDYDKEGKIVGIELLDASQQTDHPSSVVYEVAYFFFQQKRYDDLPRKRLEWKVVMDHLVNKLTKRARIS